MISAFKWKLSLFLTVFIKSGSIEYSIDGFEFFLSGVLFCSFFTKRMFPYIQNENPMTIGNNDLKFIKI